MTSHPPFSDQVNWSFSFNFFKDFADMDDHIGMDYMRSCPSPNKLFPETVRRPLRDLVTGVCPRISNSKRLRALDFQVSFDKFNGSIRRNWIPANLLLQSSNADHLRTVYDMGISMVSLGDGKVQLMHSFYNVSADHFEPIRRRCLTLFFSFPTGQVTRGRRKGSTIYARNAWVVQIANY